MERGNLEMAGPADLKEKWTGQNVSPPVLPQVPTDEKGQVHVRTLLERWESRFILHFNTISPGAGLYAKAVIAGVWKWLETYRKDHDPQTVRNMVCAEVAFHPMAKAQTTRYMTDMKLPGPSYDTAAAIQAEPP
eukprot:1650318-Amphidinium_carterae.1